MPLLPNLHRLYVHKNRLSGASSLSAIPGSCGATLRLLDLGDNLYSGLDELAPIASLAIESIDLCNCPITKIAEYRQNVFKLIPNLIYLDGRNQQGDITVGACFEGGAHLTSLTQSAVLAYGYQPRKIVPRIYPFWELKRRPPLPKSLGPSFPDSTTLSMLKEEISKLSDKLVGIVDAAVFCNEAISLQEYFHEAMKTAEDENGNRLLKYVKLPEKETNKLKMTDEGCVVLSSWIQCFTAVLASGLSWNGKLDLTHFVVLGGQVYVLKKPKPQLAQSSQRKLDGKALAAFILTIFKLDGQYPPYLLHLVDKLQNIPDGPLMRSYRLGLDTHCCCKSSMGRVNVMYQLKVKFDGLTSYQRPYFFHVLSQCKIDECWADNVVKLDIFRKILLWRKEVEGDTEQRNLVKILLSSDFPGAVAFTLIRNFGTHVSSTSVVDGKKVYKDGDGTELLIPDTFDEFVADLMFILLEHPIGQDLEIEKIAKDCMVSPINFLYEGKNASSIIKMQDSGTSYGVNEECSIDKATDEKGGEDQGSSSRDQQLERMAELSVFLSHQIRALSAKLGLDVTNEVLEVEALQEKLGLPFEVQNDAGQHEVSQTSLQFGSLPPQNMGASSSSGQEYEVPQTPLRFGK